MIGAEWRTCMHAWYSTFGVVVSKLGLQDAEGAYIYLPVWLAMLGHPISTLGLAVRQRRHRLNLLCAVTVL